MVHSWADVVGRLRAAVAVVAVLVVALSASEITLGADADWVGLVWMVRGFILTTLGALAWQTSRAGPGPWLDRALVTALTAIAVALGCVGWGRDVGLYAELLTVTLVVVAAYQWAPLRLSYAMLPAAVSSALFLGGVAVGGNASTLDVVACTVLLAILHLVGILSGRAHAVTRRRAFVQLRLAQHSQRAAELEVEKRQRIERELVIARREAEAANHAKSSFLATISHELRTPLNGVLGLSELLLRSADPTASQANEMQALHMAAEALSSVVGEVLELTQIETGGMQVQLTSFAATDVAREVADVVQRTAERQKLVVSYEGHQSGLVAQGDVARCRQVLLNFLDNALKFTAVGEITVAVMRASDGGVRFEVRDTGPGVADEEQSKVFERFYKVDAGEGSLPGSGLGLAISHDLVTAMGGSIGLVSQVGVGSCFFFELPPGDPALAQTRLPEGPVRGGALDVVIADDEPVNRRVVAGLLELLGHRTRVARDGYEAVELVQARSPDLVLMDVSMPRVDGLEATTQLRAAGCRVPIVALTAHALASDRYACLQAGMDAYLTKPVSLHALSDAIRDVLDEATIG